MTVRDETDKTPSENARVEPREAEAYLKQYVEAKIGGPARLGAEPGTRVRRSRACEVERHRTDLARK